MYFGIFYPAHHTDEITSILKKTPGWKKLADSTDEIMINDVLVIAGCNSDVDEHISCGYIAVDDMTIVGDPCDDPTEAGAEINPVAMMNLEEKYQPQVIKMCKLYKNILASASAHTINPSDIYFGWKALSCSFADSAEPTADSQGKK